MNASNILFEDEDLLVINKPSGITVNRSDTTRHELTVQDFIDEYLGFLSKFDKQNLSDTDFYKRSGIVHRIDKETSGILLIAKNLQSFENLQKQFKERVTEKTYLAFVHGKLLENEGEISVPVGRLPWNRKRFGVLAGGKESKTKYLVVERFNKPYTLLQLNPKTGRTHQIRVHLKYIGHPIFGDELYAGRKVSRADRKVLPRFFLHAQKIIFLHPKSSKKIEFEAKLPQELNDILNHFRD